MSTPPRFTEPLEVACPRCGHPNRQAARFCAHCGAPTSAGELPPASATGDAEPIRPGAESAVELPTGDGPAAQAQPLAPRTRTIDWSRGWSLGRPAAAMGVAITVAIGAQAALLRSQQIVPAVPLFVLAAAAGVVGVWLLGWQAPGLALSGGWRRWRERRWWLAGVLSVLA